jgi:two-component system, NtrC family, response regulator GlrR
MEPIHVAILELDPKACQENHGARLTMLLRDVLSPSAITVQSFHHLPSKMCSPPTLIFVRPVCAESLSELVPCLRKRWCGAAIIGLFWTGKYTPAAVSRALRTDLNDFLCCPFRDFDVFPRMQQLLQGNGQTNTTPQAEEVHAWLRPEGIVGESKPFLQVVEHTLRVASSDATILLAGETGTGKELVARAVHYGSPRRSKPFVPVNCGALPDHLVENELFGHTKGAYTDASTSEQGLVAEAEEGTLFLDEVDTLSASAQVKLLRFLQDRAYRPVGSARSRTANVRIIAATNTDLWQQVQAQRFREDLYYRLHVLAFRLPRCGNALKISPGSWPTFCIAMARNMAVALSSSRRAPCTSWPPIPGQGTSESWKPSSSGPCSWPLLLACSRRILSFPFPISKTQ